MWIKVSCPGVVKLFGEHAVVYGYHSIAVAIDSRIEIYAKPLSTSNIVVSSEDLKVSAEFRSIDNVDWSEVVHKKLMYVFKALELVMDYVNSKKGIEIIVKSNLPVSAGLGTSAAISVGTVCAYLKCHGYDIKLEEIARLGHKTELEVQGAASIMDTTVTTYGGAVVIKGNTWSRIEIPEIPIIIGYLERKYTTKDMVMKVKKLREKYSEIIDNVFKCIDSIVLKGVECLKNNDSTCLIELMNMNQKLLEVLSICSEDMTQLLSTLRSLGIGCKISGAGGNGCFIMYIPDKGVEREVIEILNKSEVKTIHTKFSSRGVLIEEVV